MQVAVIRVIFIPNWRTHRVYCDIAPELREPDGAVEGESLLNHYKRSHFPEDVSQWGSQEWIDRLQRGRNKTKFESCVNALDGIQYMRPLQKGTPQQSESIQGCTGIGLISFITLGHHWIADLLPMPVCSLEGLVEIEDGNSASSRQWALCTSLALIHRVPWNSRRWFHTRHLETASRRNSFSILKIEQDKKIGSLQWGRIGVGGVDQIVCRGIRSHSQHEEKRVLVLCWKSLSMRVTLS